MFVLADKIGIQPTQLDAGVVGRKLPVDLIGARIPVAFPRSDLIVASNV